MNDGQYSGGTRLCYSVVDPAGEASSTTGGLEDILDMFGARHSSGDLFDLVWRGEVQPSLWSPLPPPEDDMAARLYPIISGGQEPAIVAGHDDQITRDNVAGHESPADHKWEMGPAPKVEDKCGAEDSTKGYSSGRSQKKATGGAKRSQHAETHKLAEKRRRGKINEKLKTLQQIVPGCDNKSNQASTLDQTIQHIKSLQQQIQAMSFGCGGGMNSTPQVAAYPVVVPSPYLLPPDTGVVAAGLLPPAGRVVLAPAPPPAMVPFGPSCFHCMVHHPAAAAAPAAPNVGEE